MDINSYIDAISKRTSWPIAAKIIRSCDLPTTNGLEATKLKIAAEGYEPEAFDMLKKSYFELLIAGEKSVRYYRVGPTVVSRIRRSFTSADIENHVLAKSYPLPLKQNVLNKSPAGGPIFVGIEEFDEGIGLIFSSIRHDEIKEHILPSTMPEAARKILADYKEIVGTKHQKNQTFDSVWLPKSGDIISLRVDAPNGVNSGSIDTAQIRLAMKIEQIIGRPLPEAVNLFPLINGIYTARKEGTVVELAFATTTASLKHETMRRNNQCLRKELYHDGGKKALKGPITPYKLGVRWVPSNDPSGTFPPELNLMSTSQMLHSNDPQLFDAIIKRCKGLEDIEMVEEKIMKYLP